MKRTHSTATEAAVPATASTPLETLCIVDGCACGEGQGYSPCSCPGWIEVTETEYARHATWTHDDVRKLQTAAGTRTAGNIVRYHHYALAKPCAKGSKCYETLFKYDAFAVSLMPRTQPRFAAAYFMNGDFYYWPTADLADPLTFLDTAEGALRSFVDAAIFVDDEQQKIWCFEGETVSNWPRLLDLGKALVSCRIRPEKE